MVTVFVGRVLVVMDVEELVVGGSVVAGSALPPELDGADVVVSCLFGRSVLVSLLPSPNIPPFTPVASKAARALSGVVQVTNCITKISFVCYGNSV
jgi:hypothetical protein